MGENDNNVYGASVYGQAIGALGTGLGIYGALT